MKLPLATPLVTSAPKHTDFLSILLSDEDGYNWLYCHYINFFFEGLLEKGVHSKFSGGFLDLGVHPKNTCCLTRNSVIRFYEVENTLIECLINKLQEEQYIIVRIDQYYVPASWHYNKNHEQHTTMICGYDSQRSCFYIYDFYNEKYQVSEISYSNLMKAFELSKEDITLIKRNDRRYKFSLKRALTLLKDYYEGTDQSGYHFNMEYTIQGSPNYLFSTMEESNYEIIYGYQSTAKIVHDVCYVFPRKVLIHEIYEHKALMVKRLEFIQEKCEIDLKYAIEEYKNIEKMAFILRNKFLKLRLTGQSLYPLQPNALEIERAEEHILPKLIHTLEKSV